MSKFSLFFEVTGSNAAIATAQNGQSFFWSIFQRKLILVINLQNFDSFANVHPNIFVSSLLFCKSGGGVKYFTINQHKGLLPDMNNNKLLQ